MLIIFTVINLLYFPDFSFLYIFQSYVRIIFITYLYSIPFQVSKIILISLFLLKKVETNTSHDYFGFFLFCVLELNELNFKI